MTPLALNRKNAAASLDIGVDHFDKFVRPELKAVYIAGARRWRVVDLEEWLAQQV